MLNTNIILFSRTISNDYRWIYWDESLNIEEINTILSDYKNFENNKDFFISNPHVIVRELEKKIAIYHFSKTKSVDQNSRDIFALQGCVLSDIDFDIAKVFLPYICGYLFFNRLSIYTNNIADNTVNAVKSETISIDSAILEYKNNNYCFTLTQKISSFTHQYPNSSFIITNNYIKAMKESANFSTASVSRSINPLIENSSEITPDVGSTKIVNDSNKIPQKHIYSSITDPSNNFSSQIEMQYSTNIDDILNETNKDSVQSNVKRDDKARSSCVNTIYSFIKKIILK